MKRFNFSVFICSLLFMVGCSGIESEAPLPEKTEGRQISLTVSMPSGIQTRVALAETEEGNISVKWKAGDKISLCFVKGETVKTLSDVLVTNIREEDKKADFSFTLPEGIDYPFDLYGVYGATLAANSKAVTFPTAPTVAKELADAEPICVMRFEAKNLTVGAPVSVNFSHLGALMGVWLKNTSAANYTLNTLSLAGNDGYNWLYNASGQAVYDIATQTFTDAKAGASLDYPLGSSVTIAAGTTTKVYRWMVPTTAPDVSKTITATLNGTAMAQALPAKAFTAGKYYRLKLTWTGTAWRKTSIKDLTLTGNLMHADNGSNVVGIVYSKNDGKVYYNAARTNVTWEGERDLGIGSEARIAVDGNNHPHIVFKTADNKIAYLKHDGIAWSPPVYIESNAAGQCSKPDIAVAGSYAHITYTDTKGQNGAYQDKPDIMYAVNSSGSFVKKVIRNGFYEYYGGADAYADYFNKGSYIAVDGSANYYIITHFHSFSKYMGGSYRTYQTEIITSKNSAKGATESLSSDRYDIYDIAFDGTGIVALYKDNNSNRSAVIGISGAVASFTSPQPITTAITPHGISVSSSGTAIVGLAGDKLFTRYNGTETTHSDITVKANTRVAAVRTGADFFAVYTDNTNGKIIFLKL